MTLHINNKERIYDNSMLLLSDGENNICLFKHKFSENELIEAIKDLFLIEQVRIKKFHKDQIIVYTTENDIEGSREFYLIELPIY